MTNKAKVRNLLIKIHSCFQDLIQNRIREFEVLRKEYVPEGLKPHTRSICWLAEQVILQNLHKYTKDNRMTAFEYPSSDIEVWDVRFKFPAITSKFVHINIKVTDSNLRVRRNDIASVKKLIDFYDSTQDALLFYVVIKISFRNTYIDFVGAPIVRYYPWIGNIYVNPRNHHLQCVYEVDVVKRNTEDFIAILKENADIKNVGY